MKRMLFALSIAFVCLSMLATGTMAAGTGPPAPPGQPVAGYGSPARYICSGYTRLEQGFAWIGTKVTCFVPDKLKNGTTAPVVIFLHGFKIVWPEFYLDFLGHLARQGYIVICPNANVGSLLGSFFETDQNVFMQRAIDNANKGLAMVAGKADLANVTVFGHSLGALLGACWMGSGGIRPKRIVLANVSTDPSTGIPDFVRQFIHITPIDWRTKAGAVDVPVILLTGDRDTLAPSQQAKDMYDSLVNSPSRVLYCLQTDGHGSPAITGNHNMSLSSSWIMPDWLMDSMLGGAGKVDAADWRYCWAAMDAAMDGRNTLTFKMGKWSDGVPVKPVLRLAP